MNADLKKLYRLCLLCYAWKGKASAACKRQLNPEGMRSMKKFFKKKILDYFYFIIKISLNKASKACFLFKKKTFFVFFYFFGIILL